MNCRHCGQSVEIPTLGTEESVACADCITNQHSFLKSSIRGLGSSVTLATHLYEKFGFNAPQSRHAREGHKLKVGTLIGKGGMGLVFNALDLEVGRDLAMKVMKSHGDETRFIREAQITGGLQHPNIVPIHELGVDAQGRFFYLMKRVDGITLKDILTGISDGDETIIEKYSFALLIQSFLKVCDAIRFCHSKGIIHRDLKPENIMVGDHGEVLVLDWGLAKRASDDTTEAAATMDFSTVVHTQAGAILGTPGFMSPEQAMGRLDQIDERSDIYSLGAILYQILTLRPPVEGSNALDVIRKTAKGGVVPPVGARAAMKLMHLPLGRIPFSLNLVSMKSLAKNRRDRYTTVADLRADIDAYLNGQATSVERHNIFRQLILLIKRNRKSVSVIGTASLILLAAFLINFREVRAQRVRATEAASSATEKKERAAGLKETAWLKYEEYREEAPAFYAQAESLARLCELEDATAMLDHALELQPANLKYRCLRIEFDLARLDMQKVKTDCDKVLVIYPDAEYPKSVADFVDNTSGIHDRVELRKRVATFFLKNENIVGLRYILPDLNSGDLQVNAYTMILEHAGANFKLARKPAGIDLELQGKSTTLSINCLRGMQLNHLKIIGNKQFKDHPFPENLKVNSLELYKSGVVDMRYVRQLNLKSLHVNYQEFLHPEALKSVRLKCLKLYNLDFSSINFLKGFSLNELRFRYCDNVKDISTLKGMKLRTLVLWGTSVTDITPLEEMPLKFLRITNGPPLSDVIPLKNMPLDEFVASYISDLEFLADSQIKVMFLFRSQIKNLDHLKNLPLKSLVLSDSTVEDVSAISNLKLYQLELSGCTKLRELPSLAHMPMGFLRVDGSGIKYLADLPRTLREVVLLKCQAKDPRTIETLSKLPHLCKIRTYDNAEDWNSRKDYNKKQYMKTYGKFSKAPDPR